MSGVEPDALVAAPDAELVSPVWWAVRVEHADGVEHNVFLSAGAVAECIAAVSRGDERILISQVSPSELAALRIDEVFPRATLPPSALEGASIDGRAAPGVPTAEEVATWSVGEIKALLNRALVTEAQACRELSRVEGSTVGLADVVGHPERAVVLLAFCAQSGRRAS